MSEPHILVVDDERDIRELVKEILEEEGYDVAVAENGEEARRVRRTRRPDLALLDVWMPDVDGVSLLKEWTEEQGAAFPVIMMSGHSAIETAVEATRLGAYDFIEKPLSLAKLLLTVKRALEVDRLQRENINLKRHIQPVEVVGKGIVMQQLRDKLKRVAQHDAWVLISGEAGSGKEMFARYIHAGSVRSNGPFVTVSVAAVTRENRAVELFGREDGEKIRYGYLEQANGGTLFLDELGDMEADIQAWLLAALESRSFLRINGTAPVQFDARIIAATHHNLELEVRAGQFRDDLYYHLNVVPVHIPPLREHYEDIPELVNYYINLFVNQDNLPYRSFTVAALNKLRNYAWPGNVRELKNLVQRMLILGSGDEISLDEVEIALGKPSAPLEAGVPYEFTLPLREAREQFEKAYLEHQLRESGGSVGRVAKTAGMERTHLYRKLRALGINPKED